MTKTIPNRYYKPYWCFAVLRILLVFIPHLGYIHPDEYFQSIEVLVANFFKVEANIPWDFNATFPIRSIGITYFTIGTSYKILTTLDRLVQFLFNISIITPYILIITPRLFICILSFLVDNSLYTICVSNNEKYKSKLFILSSSYVMIVYGTRTFSNTIELILFSILLRYISDSMIVSNVIVKQHEYLRKRYYKARSVVERAQLHKLKLYLAPHNLKNFFIVSTIVVLGFFNRPTFLCYAVFPIFFWLYRGLGFETVSGLQFHVRMFVVLVAAIPTILFLVLVDSFYYGYISWGEIGMLDVTINSFVLPCFNFIKYNVDEKNLEQHGIHPKYLHLFVNVPLLFHVLGIFALVDFGNIILKLSKRKYHLLPTVRSIRGLMSVSLVAPLVLLSIFSHQEPRFIIPLLFPMVYLYAHKIYEEPENALMKRKGLGGVGNVQVKNNLALKMWLILNCVLTLFFGFVHQGGILPSTNYLANDIQLNCNTQYSIVTSHIYNIPQSLLLERQHDGKQFKNYSKPKLHKRIFVYEEGSKNLDLIFKKIDTILKANEHSKKSSKLVLLIPSSLNENIENIAKSYDGLRVKNVITFYPHISTEALPNLTEILHLFMVADIKSLQFNDVLDSFANIFRSLGLTIYNISLTKESKYEQDIGS